MSHVIFEEFRIADLFQQRHIRAMPRLRFDLMKRLTAQLFDEGASGCEAALAWCAGRRPHIDRAINCDNFGIEGGNPSARKKFIAV